MRADLVELTPEVFDQDLRINPILEPLHIQALVSELAVEGFILTCRLSADHFKLRKWLDRDWLLTVFA